MHLVLKTSKAKGRYAFSPSDRKITTLIQRMGNKFGVKIYSTAQNWSHIHIVIRLPNRLAYQKFIRALTGAMVIKLRATKGFFDLTPYTKITSWGRQFQNLKSSAQKNELQAWGLMVKPISTPSSRPDSRSSAIPPSKPLKTPQKELEKSAAFGPFAEKPIARRESLVVSISSLNLTELN